MNSIKILSVVLFAFSIVIFNCAHAQDTNVQSKDASDLPYVYAPEGCGFTIKLPSEPYAQNRCEPFKPDACYEIASFTKVYGIDASLRVDITCSAVSEDAWAAYDLDTMKATLVAMSDPDIITVREQFADDYGTHKRATVLGDGMQGQTPSLFVGEFLIDKSSAFSVKAEIVGSAPEEADEVFSRILRSITVK